MPEREEQTRGVARGASIVAVGTLVSRLLGVLRDMVLAAIFHREVTDAFFVAFTIPNLLRQVVGEGAMSSAVVPVLAKTRTEEGPARVREAFAKLRAVSLVALAVLTVLGVFLAVPLTELFAAGLHARPGAFEMTARMTRIVFPYIFFMGSAALGAAALQVERRFFTTSFAPMLLNISFVVGAWVLPPLLPGLGLQRTDALVIAALIGGFLQMVAQWPELSRAGYFGRPIWSLRDPALTTALKRFLPQLFGVGVYYIDVAIARRFLSGLGEGAQSYFTWAQRMCDFPQGIFVMAISTAALPAFAELASKSDREPLRKAFSFGLRLALYVAIPSSIGLIVVGEPLVRLVFQRGMFDATATTETVNALRWQGAAVAGVAIARQTSSLFFAMGDTKTPTVVGAIDLVVFVVAAILLRGPLGHVGVSAAVFASTAVQAGLLAFLATRKLGAGLGLWKGAAGMVLAALLAAASARGLAWGAGMLIPRLIHGAFVDVMTLASFAVVYGACTWAFGLEEARTLTGALSRRLRKR